MRYELRLYSIIVKACPRQLPPMVFNKTEQRGEIEKHGEERSKSPRLRFAIRAFGRDSKCGQIAVHRRK